jgi:hypothetical protein
LCKSLSFKTAYFARESLTQPKRESGMAWGIWEGDYAAQYIRSLSHFDRSRLPKRRGTLSVHRGPSSCQSERVGPWVTTVPPSKVVFVPVSFAWAFRCALAWDRELACGLSALPASHRLDAVAARVINRRARSKPIRRAG